MARKWGDRYNEAKIKEFYGKVLELDPQGTSGTYTHEYYKVTAPYRDYAELALASQNVYGEKADMGPLKAFIAKYPNSPLLKRAWDTMSSYYAYQAPKDQAAAFFQEYAAKFPDDPSVLASWIDRIVQDEGPADKGLELMAKIKKIPALSPYSMIEQQEAALYLLKGDKAKAEEVFGKDVMSDKVDNFAYSLVGYANFWIDKDANKDSAVAMAEKALLLMPDQRYFIQQAAGIYAKAGMEPKALAIYGPDYLQKNMNDAANLYAYASFWNRQGKNLESAAVAAEKACALKPGLYYYWNTLSAVYAKMKKYPEAIKAGEKAVEVSKNKEVKDAMQKALDKIKKDAEKK